MEEYKKLIHLCKYRNSIYIYLCLKLAKSRALYHCILKVVFCDNLHIEMFFVRVYMYFVVQ